MQERYHFKKYLTDREKICLKGNVDIRGAGRSHCNCTRIFPQGYKLCDGGVAGSLLKKETPKETESHIPTKIVSISCFIRFTVGKWRYAFYCAELSDKMAAGAESCRQRHGRDCHGGAC